MKLLCNTVVVNRKCPNLKSSATKSTLAIGFHPPGKPNAELFIIHFTAKNKSGVRYKVKDNLERVFTTFIQDGKATISFKIPEHNIMINCDPIQLRSFLSTLKLGLNNKREMRKLGVSTLSVTPVPERNLPVDKMIIRSQAEYPLKGFPRNLKSLSILGLKRERLPLSVLSLSNLQALDLTGNKLTKLPKEFGKLRLVDLNMADNFLGTCMDPDCWDWVVGKPFVDTVKTLDISNNQLNTFPYKLVKLSSVITLKLDNNAIKRLPFSIRRLRSMKNLILAENKLESLPEVISHMNLSILDVWGNKFCEREATNGQQPFQTVKKIPLLWELAARVVLIKNLPFSPATIPRELADIMEEAPKCICGRFAYSGQYNGRSVIMSFDCIKNLIFSRERVIYGDTVICESLRCSKRLLQF